MEAQRHGTIFLVSALTSAVAVSLVLARVAYSGQVTFAFLIWNLFLAWLPLFFAYLAERAYRKNLRVNLLVAFYGLAWLLFFPNAPYIVTDFLHLQERAPVPLWYDLVLLFSFAWAGLFLGFNSLYLMQQIVLEKAGRVKGWLFTFLVLGLSSFGVYLGRFGRWNSWDVLLDPRGLAADILNRIIHPIAHYRTYVISLLFTVVFASIYLTLFALTLVREQHKASGNGRGNIRNEA